MLVTLSFSLGRQGGIDKGITQEICEKKHASKEALKATKQVICKEAFKPLKDLMSELNKEVARYTTRWFHKGTRLSTPKNIEKVVELCDEYFPKLQEIKDDHLLARYAHWKELTRAQSGDAFKEYEFPQFDDLRDNVKWTVDIMILPEAEAMRAMKNISDVLMDELVRSQDARVQSGVKAAMAEAYSRLLEPLNNMCDVLSKDKPKIFECLVTNVRAIVDEIPGLNLTDDPELQQFADQANTMLATITPDRLREDKVLRQETVDKARQLVTQFAAVGKRKFALETEEPEAQAEAVNS